jgi:hypothetical protein
MLADLLANLTQTAERPNMEMVFDATRADLPLQSGFLREIDKAHNSWDIDEYPGTHAPREWRSRAHYILNNNKDNELLNNLSTEGMVSSPKKSHASSGVRILVAAGKGGERASE